ncbi:MAG: hypothetical protein RL169_556, partial [Armatimonadota bacterium]
PSDAAAEAAASDGASVIIVEPTSVLGGQLTSQLVPVPDENQYVGRVKGAATDRYRALREDVRALYAAKPGVRKQAANNIGQCWVSPVSGLPSVWSEAIQARLAPFVQNGRLKHTYLRHQLRRIVRYSGNGDINYVEIVNLEDGHVRRIAPKIVVDATEDGSAAYLAGCPTRIGQEAESVFGEPLAPDVNHPEWVQSFTYGFLLRWEMDSQKQKPAVAPPAEYETFKNQGEYTLDYVYRGNGIEAYSVPYGVLAAITHTSVAGTRTYQPFWTYRRLEAAGSFTGGKSPQGDIALINWRGNDFHMESYIDKPLDDQVRVLNRGRDFAIGFLHWLQTECPRDDGKGKGYPEMQPLTAAEEPLVDELGVALHPYIRESRRIIALEMLTSVHMEAISDEKRWGTEFADSIGCAHYAIDIHPSANEPHLLHSVVPYHIPLGALIPVNGPRNLVAGAKNFGASRLALASARMHPSEWLVGEVAGMLAAMSTRQDLHPAKLRASDAHRKALLEHISAAGITRYWSEILDVAK